MNRLFRFQYFTNENPLLHQVRDLTIVMELIEILINAGYSYVDSFLNHPRITDLKRQPYQFKKSDLMIMPTRPPLSDVPGGRRRVIYKTGHALEEEMFKQLFNCFSILDRQSMSLQNKIARNFPRKYLNRKSVEFFVNTTENNPSAAYSELSNLDARIKKTIWYSNPENKQTSCAFLIFFPANSILPKMLYVFGMGGQEGLMFARMLKNGLWENLEMNLDGSARFVMVEFPIDKIQDKPTSLKFVKNVDYKVILDTKFKVK